MSKKIKRQVSRSTSETVVDTGVVSQKAASPVSSRVSLTTEFNPDYSHIIKDLKMIGTLAAAFIGLLVVLSFFLR
jgi:hypothetical protein